MPVADEKSKFLDDTQAGGEHKYFGMDAEWDTYTNPYSSGKLGRIPLIQIGFRDKDEQFTRALLVKLNKQDKQLPAALQSFLRKA